MTDQKYIVTIAKNPAYEGEYSALERLLLEQAHAATPCRAVAMLLDLDDDRAREACLGMNVWRLATLMENAGSHWHRAACVVAGEDDGRHET